METENHINQALSSLAWRIWSAGGGPVKIDDLAIRAGLEPMLHEGIILEDEKGLQFASELSLVQAAAEYVLQDEGSLLTSAPKTCFEMLNKIYKKEIGKKYKVSGRVLAQLHNSEKIDAYNWGREAIIAGVRVFTALQVMEGAVNSFENARAESIFHFFTGHYDTVKNDAFGGMVYSNLQPWFAQHPDTAREVIHLHESNPDEKSNGLYTCSLRGLSEIEFSAALELLVSASQSPNLWISRPAVYVMGLVDYSDPSRNTALKKTVQICSQIIRALGHPLLGTAVCTLCNLVALNENAIVKVLDEVGKRAEPEALFALSDFLWREAKTTEEKDWFWPMVLHLTSTKADHKGILENLDMMLDGWVRDPERRPRVLEFLNTWISKQPKDTFDGDGLDAFFSSTVHGLAEQLTILSRVLTDWLLQEDGRYPLVAQKLVSRFHMENAFLELDPVIIDQLSMEEIRFLLRRILGYVVGDEMQVRLVFSLVRTREAKDRTFGYVASVLRDQVGNDYPYQTIEYLKDRQNAEEETSEVRELCNQIVTDLQAGLDALDALPALKEFRSSSMKALRFAKERRRQMNEAFEEASKNSIFRQLATHIPLKAGLRSFQAINGRYTDPMELKGMSHSIAIPRSEISDPAGAARERLLFRRAKRDSP